VANSGVLGQRGVAASVQAATAVAAPGALATIVTVTPGAGVWEVWADAAVIGGAPAAADVGNMRLRQVAATLLATLPTTSALGSPIGPLGPIRITLISTDTLNIVSIGAATAGTTYWASVLATQIG
jgi:hypothetical protein